MTGTTPQSAADLDLFVDVLAPHMPAGIFIDVVRRQRMLDEKHFALLRRWTADDPTAARRQIAKSVVDEYAKVGRASHLANGLYQEIYLDDDLAPRIYPFTSRGNSNLQGAIAQRAHTMNSRKLREFLAKTEGHVCIVVAENDTPGPGEPAARLGTGFLVGPDIVLTAYHTLVDHLVGCQRKTPTPGRLYAVFDHYEGDPLRTPIQVPPESLTIPFVEDWLLDCKESMPDDGLFRVPDPVQLTLLPTHLDFALMKLARPVGNQSRSSIGGPRREWIELPTATPNVGRDERIIIPQHPNGYPQRIDFGRFSEADSKLDTSNTRLRYDTETDNGTSGAPCFDRTFSLVGMHNAAFKPGGDVLKNQAIRIERIRAALNPTVGPSLTKSGTAARLWSTSTGDEPSVILGRRRLLDWLQLAVADQVHATSERVYAAIVDAPDSKGYGKSFTLEVLRAARRGTGEPIVVLGPQENRLPTTVGDFIRAVAFQLGMPQDLLKDLPARPSADHPVTSPNGDKLDRWASEDVPAWFDRKLTEFRERVVDKRDEARDHIEYLRQKGLAPSPEELELAQSPTPVPDTRQRWARAWIVITDLPTPQIGKDVRELIAGMIVGKRAEDSMLQQLRRFRWLFIGLLPDNVIETDRVTPETLDPMKIGPDELVEAMQCLADSTAQTLEEDAIGVARIYAELMFSPEVDSASLKNPAKRLRVMQQSLFPAIRQKLPTIRRGGV